MYCIIGTPRNIEPQYNIARTITIDAWCSVNGAKGCCCSWRLIPRWLHASCWGRRELFDQDYSGCSIPWRESMSERRFVLVDFTHMSGTSCLRAGETYTMPRAVAHAAAKRGLVAKQRPSDWTPCRSRKGIAGSATSFS